MTDTVRSIRLARYAVPVINWTYYGGFRLRVVATDASGPDLDKYIFIYASRPADPYTGASRDEFQAVCGPAQMSLPINEPDVNNNYPFYRKDEIEIDFTSQSQALEVWEIIKTETRILVESMGKFSQLEFMESIAFTETITDDGEITDTVSEST